MNNNYNNTNSNYSNNNRTNWQNNANSNNQGMNSQGANNTASNIDYERSSDGSSTLNGFTTPSKQDFSTTEFQGQIQQILSYNVGEYVLIEFMPGTSDVIRKQGIIYYVGVSYVVLYDDEFDNFIICDVFSIRFVYMYRPGDRPNQNINNNSNNQR